MTSRERLVAGKEQGKTCASWKLEYFQMTLSSSLYKDVVVETKKVCVGGLWVEMAYHVIAAQQQRENSLDFSPN